MCIILQTFNIIYTEVYKFSFKLNKILWEYNFSNIKHVAHLLISNVHLEKIKYVLKRVITLKNY